MRIGCESCKSTNMRIESSKIVYPELSYQLSGLCFDVHNQLGRFLNEKQYGDALAGLLEAKKIDFVREYPVEFQFGNRKIGGTQFIDFLVDKKVILELKAKHFLTREDYYQVKRYLKITGCKLALVVNFRDRRLKPKRILNSSSKV